MDRSKFRHWGAPQAGSDRRIQHPRGWAHLDVAKVVKPHHTGGLRSLSTGSQAGDVPQAHCSMYSQAQIILLTIRRASLTPRDQES